MDNIYLHHEDQQIGPFNEEAIRQYLKEGRIQPTTLGWVEGSDWKPIGDMMGIVTSSHMTPPPTNHQQAVAYGARQTQAEIHQANPKKLILASWLMIGVTCLVALIPGVGFLTWIIAFPVLLVTFILGIITLTKGRTLQGVSILLTSLIAAPIFLVVAPIVTTAGVVAATESGSATNFDEDFSDNLSSSDDPPINQAVASIGDKVKMNDSVWEVVSAKELGNMLDETDFAEAKRSEGKFIYVQYKVTNNTAEEQAVLFTPSIRDSKGRRFEEMDDLEFYLKDNETGMTMEQLPSGLAKKFAAIFEVPADASGFMFMARDFEAFQKQEKGIKLGF